MINTRLIIIKVCGLSELNETLCKNQVTERLRTAQKFYRKEYSFVEI